MKISQRILRGPEAPVALEASDGCASRLVLVFGSTSLLTTPGLPARLESAFPAGTFFVGCSTSGEITRDGVLDGVLTITMLEFDGSQVRVEKAAVPEMGDSRAAGETLGSALRGEGLRCVLVFSDGLHVNGSEVVKGLRAQLGDEVVISGGLAGDGTAFARTAVLVGGSVGEKIIGGVGLYGERLCVRNFSAGGWHSFGNLMRVTKARGSKVYELDGFPALEVYSKYLGADADGLPASGLLRPVALEIPGSGCGLVRTLLGIDRNEGSLTFAGDVPEGQSVRLMQATFAQLVEGAGRAGRETGTKNCGSPPGVALLVSCVGRRMVLGAQTDLEIEAVAECIPSCEALAGFYSYGEIGFFEGSGVCELHNQTMTVTTLAELPAGAVGK